MCWVLAGCASAPEPVDPANVLRLSADALHPTGSDLVISMGRDRGGVVRVVSRLLAAPPDRTVSCGDGEGVALVGWASGLTLYFDSDGLAGWAAAGTGLSTVDGLSIGQPPVAADPRIRAEVFDGVVRVMRSGRSCAAGGAGPLAG